MTNVTCLFLEESTTCLSFIAVNLSTVNPMQKEMTTCFVFLYILTGRRP